MKGILIRAMKSRNPVQLIYEDSDGRLSQRTVTIKRVNKSHVLVWCFKKNGLRSLKRSNILAAEPYNHVRAI